MATAFPILFFIALILLGTQTVPEGFFQTTAGQFSDLKIYWSAFQCNLAGHNPYDLESCLEKSNNLATFVAPVWNPPWFFTVSAPLLLWKTFDQVLLVYFALLIASFLIIYKLLPYTSLCKKTSFLPALFIFTILCCTAQVGTLVYAGQLGSFLFMAQLLALWSFSQRKDFLTGLLLSCVSIKPHFCFLVSGLIIFQSILDKRWLVIISGCIGLGFLLGIQLFINPDLITFWINTSRLPAEFLGTNTSTFLSQINLIEEANRFNFAILLSLFTILVLIFYLLHLKSKNLRPDLEKITGPLICISLLTAPYGFVFDHFGLLLPSVEIMFLAFSKKNLKAFTAIALLYAVWTMNPFKIPIIYYYSFFPLIVLVLLGLIRRNN